jgi:uncharacterized Zn finger protein (UPF0148 family)
VRDIELRIQRHGRHPIRIYPAGRSCERCGGPLSIYNGGTLCNPCNSQQDDQPQVTTPKPPPAITRRARETVADKILARLAEL